MSTTSKPNCHWKLGLDVSLWIAWLGIRMSTHKRMSPIFFGCLFYLFNDLLVFQLLDLCWDILSQVKCDNIGNTDLILVEGDFVVACKGVGFCKYTWHSLRGGQMTVLCSFPFLLPGFCWFSTAFNKILCSVMLSSLSAYLKCLELQFWMTADLSSLSSSGNSQWTANLLRWVTNWLTISSLFLE